LAIGCPYPTELPLYADELDRWLEFHDLEPFGDDWRQTALLAYISAAKGGAKNLELEDFMPIKKEPQSDAEIMMRMNMMFEQIGGKTGA
jgi:hypothetical protein